MASSYTDNQKKPLHYIVDMFNQKNIRLTPQRISVYQFLLENRIHPTVDQVYTALKLDCPGLSKTTIYNTIETLTQADLIKVIRVAEGEVRLDATMESHGHFKCNICSNVIDFNLSECTIPSSLDSFNVEEFELKASGICPDCQPKT